MPRPAGKVSDEVAGLLSAVVFDRASELRRFAVNRFQLASGRNLCCCERNLGQCPAKITQFLDCRPWTIKWAPNPSKHPNSVDAASHLGSRVIVEGARLILGRTGII